METIKIIEEIDRRIESFSRHIDDLHSNRNEAKQKFGGIYVGEIFVTIGMYFFYKFMRAAS